MMVLTIYVDMDSLLDTRLGTIAKINPSVALKLTESESYYHRYLDEFEGIDKDIYQKAYRQRDKTTLQNASVTKMIFTLRDTLAEVEDNIGEDPIHSGIKLVINLYPYILTDNEKEELKTIIRGLLKLHPLIETELIYLNPFQLNCDYLRNGFVFVYMYNYDEWLNHRVEDLKKRPLTETGLFFPMIYKSHLPEKEAYEVYKHHEGITNHFQYLSSLYEILIKMVFLPIEHYSIIH